VEEENLFKWVVGTLLSGLGTALLVRFLDKKKTQVTTINALDNGAQNKIVKIAHSEDYKTLLGKRHIFVRTELLQLSERKMANFYGFDTVSELVEYESGNFEFPQSLLNKVCDFFFIKQEMFDLDCQIKYPFKSFRLYSSEINEYIEQGFSLVIACSPNDRETDLYCYVLLCKKENDFYRVITSNNKGRFKSGHTGKNNIEQLIHAMIKRGMDETNVRIVSVTEELWLKIESREFAQYIEKYDLDWDCQDIFDKWFFEYNRKFGNELRSQWLEQYDENEKNSV
jgi:hypothetical protein